MASNCEQPLASSQLGIVAFSPKAHEKLNSDTLNPSPLKPSDETSALSNTLMEAL